MDQFEHNDQCNNEQNSQDNVFKHTFSNTVDVIILQHKNGI